MNSKIFSIGIDISKARLDVYFQENQCHKIFDNTSSGLKKLQTTLKGLKNPIHRIILEPSGGYEKMVFDALMQAAYQVSLVNPKKTRDFPKAIGKLEKTDKLDAQILAHYGTTLSPPLSILKTPFQAHLSALISRRTQVVNRMTQERLRLEKATHDQSLSSIQKILTCLREEIKDLEEKIERCLEAQEEAQEMKILTSEKGIGRLTAASLMGQLPELGQLSNQEIAKLVGVAPLNQDSGQKRGRRKIRGDRQTVRQALYMATWVAARHHEKVKKFYERLKQKGKKPKIALIAAMRKFLCILNTKMACFRLGKNVY